MHMRREFGQGPIRCLCLYDYDDCRDIEVHMFPESKWEERPGTWVASAVLAINDITGEMQDWKGDTFKLRIWEINRREEEKEADREVDRLQVDLAQ